MITVRPAQREEAADILDFQMRMAYETENILLDKLIVSKGIAAVFDDPSKGTYYVALYNEKVVGCFLITSEWSDWRNGTIWWLQSAFVDISYRRLGVFKHMYNFVLDTIAKDRTLVGLRLYVDKSNERARNVYRSLGMNGDHYEVFEKMC